MAKPQNPVKMAEIGAPHGVRGELRIKSFTADPLALGSYGPLYDEDGRAFSLGRLRPAKTMVVGRIKGIDTREKAATLTGVSLYIDRSALPDDALEEDEFYQADLVGLGAFSADGDTIGTVVAIHDFGGGDLVEIALAGRKTVLIPFTKAAVPTIDIGAGRMTVDPIAAGLVDTPDDEEPDP